MSTVVKTGKSRARTTNSTSRPQPLYFDDRLYYSPVATRLRAYNPRTPTKPFSNRVYPYPINPRVCRKLF